jgi:hypothetical protein
MQAVAELRTQEAIALAPALRAHFQCVRICHQGGRDTKTMNALFQQSIALHCSAGVSGAVLSHIRHQYAVWLYAVGGHLRKAREEVRASKKELADALAVEQLAEEDAASYTYQVCLRSVARLPLAHAPCFVVW